MKCWNGQAAVLIQKLLILMKSIGIWEKSDEDVGKFNKLIHEQ
jgi:hypothetical protein